VRDANGPGHHLLAMSHVQPSALKDFTFSTNNKKYTNKDLFLKIKDVPTTRPGDMKTPLENIPLYCNVVPIPTGEVDINYYHFYAYNGPVLAHTFIPNAIASKAGCHEGDWEHVTLRISPDCSKLRSVYMSRHGYSECRWYMHKQTAINKDDGYQINEEGKLVIYIAKESHANYAVPGRQDRGHMGVVDDYTGFGRLWRPLPEYLVNMGNKDGMLQDWAHFTGNWGGPGQGLVAGGPFGPIGKGSFVNEHQAMTKYVTVPIIERYPYTIEKKN